MVHQENTHDYLGMFMSHDVENQKVMIDMRKYMRKYIHDCVQEFQDHDIDEKLHLVNTPATIHLFKTRNVEKISQRKSKIFHSAVAKLLFVAKRARPDILLAVSFLTTWVHDPDSDDWRKLI
jgi:hypothetical protein